MPPGPVPPTDPGPAADPGRGPDVDDGPVVGAVSPSAAPGADAATCAGVTVVPHAATTTATPVPSTARNVRSARGMRTIPVGRDGGGPGEQRGDTVRDVGGEVDVVEERAYAETADQRVDGPAELGQVGRLREPQATVDDEQQLAEGLVPAGLCLPDALLQLRLVARGRDELHRRGDARAPAAVGVDRRGEDREDLLVGGGLFDRVTHGDELALGDPLEDGEEEVGLAAEVGVDRAGGVAGGGGEAVDGRVAVAVGEEHVLGRRKQPFAGDLADALALSAAGAPVGHAGPHSIAALSSSS